MRHEAPRREILRREIMASRLDGLGTTIFAEMSALALATGSVNLGQGFPDTDGPKSVIEAAVDAMRGGANQYPPGPGIPALRTAIAEHQRRFYGLAVDPDTEVLVTTGATEAIAAAMLGLVEPGDEVVALEPYYDSYAASIAMAGGVRVPVTLAPPAYRLDAGALRAAVGERTRLLLVNTPHNPTGAVLSPDELRRDRCRGRRAGPPRGHRRGLRAHDLRRRAARAARDAARHARAHSDDLLVRQDLLADRVEDRLVHGAGRSRHGRTYGQAVPHLRERRAVPARHRGRARAARRLLRRPAERPPGQARPAL
jgi:hypothetical protein